MKKALLSFSLTLVVYSIAQAQCPTSIVPGVNDFALHFAPGSLTTALCASLTGPGTSGAMTLSSSMTTESDNYVANSGCFPASNRLDISFSGLDASVELAHQPVTLTIPGFATGCAYNTMGQLIVMPVELTTFTAQTAQGRNALHWTTASEVNNKGFQVERSPQPPQGALTTWDIIGFVDAKGKAATYSFTDVAPPSGVGGTYYRLRQIDNDGKETLSKVVSVSAKGINKLKVYPNPVSNVLTIETSTTGTFDIINLLGQQVLTGRTPPSGAGRLDVSTLLQGTYFLKVGEEQVKFVKQ